MVTRMGLKMVSLRSVWHWATSMGYQTVWHSGFPMGLLKVISKGLPMGCRKVMPMAYLLMVMQKVIQMGFHSDCQMATLTDYARRPTVKRWGNSMEFPRTG